jgi:peptide/nickel transport system substrate-binding protein
MSLSRRLFLVLLFVPLLAASIGPSPATAQADDTIVIGTTDLPASLDPAEAYDFMAWEVLSHLYTGLVRQVPGTLDYELALAESYTVSADALVYTFTLRQGQVFSDGTPITAQTFVESVTRVLALRRPAVALVEPYVAGVSAPSPYELIFTLKRPTPCFLQLLALPAYYPQHPALASTTTPQPFGADIVGNGPYRLERFAVRQEIVLRANPTYAFGPAPKTGTIVLRQFSRSQDLREALLAHEVDIAWRALLLDDVQRLDGQPGLRVLDLPATRTFYLYLNQNREPTDDPLVREALTLLIDRSALAGILGDYATPLTALVPSQFETAYVPLWPDAPDIPTAEATLRAAGYKERGTPKLNITVGFSLPLYGVPYADAVTRLVRASFQPTSFVDYSTFTDIDGTTFRDVLEEGGIGLAVFAWTPLVPHPYAYLFPLLHSSQALPTNGRFARPELDLLLDQIAGESDAGAQAALYAQLAEWVLDDHALVPLWQDHLQIVAWDTLEGIAVAPNYWLSYAQLTRR